MKKLIILLFLFATVALGHVTDSRDPTDGSLNLYSRASKYFLRLRVPDQMTVSKTFTLPADTGTANYFLQTDGAGVLSWAAAAAGGVAIGDTVTSATAGSVLFAGAAGVLAQDNAGLYWDDASNRLGIGTTAPGQNLTVNGTFGILEGGAAPAFHTIFQGGDQAANVTLTLPVDDGTANQVLQTDGSGVLSWTTPSNAAAIGGTITSGTTGSVLFVGAGPVFAQDNASVYWDDVTNRLGIGTTVPGTALDVRGDVTLLGGSDIRPTANSTSAVSFANAAGTDILSIDTTNNRVGIGTTTPNQQLELTGNIRLPASTSTTGIYYNGTSTFLHNFGSSFSVFLGVNAGNLTNTGANNAGIGPFALDALTSGGQNVAMGTNALGSVTSTSSSTGIGYQALRLATGAANTAVGSNAGGAVTSGTLNTVVGSGAMGTLVSGSQNVAIGFGTLADLTGSNSTGVGERALENATGSNNSSLGRLSGAAVITGSSNTFLGYLTDTTLSSITNSTAIGADAIVAASNSMVLGSIATPVSVGIGTNAPGSRFEIVGAADVLQTQVRANATQTANILNVETSAGSDLFTVQGDGAVAISETGANGGNVPHERIRRSSTTNTSATCTVTCSAGETLTGGGCQNSLALNLANNYPSADATWSCEYTLATGNCTAWAVCFDY